MNETAEIDKNVKFDEISPEDKERIDGMVSTIYDIFSIKELCYLEQADENERDEIFKRALTYKLTYASEEKKRNFEKE